MPIYEYECKACGHEWEAMQKFSDPAFRKCESCGKAQARRKISQSSFVLKGNGWYVTDYAKSQAKSQSQAQEAKSDTPSST